MSDFCHLKSYNVLQISKFLGVKKTLRFIVTI